MKYFFLLVFVCLIAFGCSKENSDLFIPYNGDPANDTSWALHVPGDAAAYTLFAKLSNNAFIDSFENNTGAAFHVNDNLDIQLDSNSCVYNNGAAVSGKVSLELRHLSRKGDFIRFAKPTTSYGKLFESAGMLYIKLLKQDQEVFLKQGQRFYVNMKDASPVNTIRLFHGVEALQAPLPTGTNPMFTWATQADSSSVVPYINGNAKGYNLSLHSLNWINCQSYLDSNVAKTNIACTLPVSFTNRNTTVFAVFKQRKTVVQLNPDYSSRTFFAPNLPVGTNVMLVSLSLVGNQYYLGIKDVTVSAGMFSIVTPTARTLTEVNTFLNGL